jgi:hypothetical protein
VFVGFVKFLEDFEMFEFFIWFPGVVRIGIAFPMIGREVRGMVG